MAERSPVIPHKYWRTLDYWQHDIPAVMITDTAFYRNKQYHLPGDTADRLNYQKMAQVVDGVITLLYNSK
ncbi:hypothetical protein C0P24_002866 [Escherichia coli]|nr:hypothetical protein [Escherichia coli]